MSCTLAPTLPSRARSQYNKVEDIPADVLRQAKVLGFSDFQIARFVLEPQGNMEKENLMVRARRKELGILPAVKRINTIASEHPELTIGLFFEAAGFVFTLSVIRESKPFPNPFLTAIVTPFLFTNLYDPRFPLQACGNSLPPQICYRTY